MARPSPGLSQPSRDLNFLVDGMEIILHNTASSDVLPGVLCRLSRVKCVQHSEKLDPSPDTLVMALGISGHAPGLAGALLGLPAAVDVKERQLIAGKQVA